MKSLAPCLVLLTLALAAFAPGCGSCEEAGCPNGLDLEFSITQDGSYTFYLLVDDEEVTCTMTLPCGAEPPACSGKHIDPLVHVCAPSGDESLFAISMYTRTPEAVNVVVHRDAVEVLSRSLSPTYMTLEPNGESCGPTCQHAAEHLTLP